MKKTSWHGKIRAGRIVLLFTAALLLNNAYCFAETIQTAATGQKYCYSEMGAGIICDGTGQDGEFRAGVQWPATRFLSDTTNCYIIDALTGLWWARNAKKQCADNWMAAMTYTESLSLCGYTDWRAANIDELESLVHAGLVDLPTYLGSLGFTGIQAGYYFSSTSYLNDNSTYPSPWSMSMQDGTGTGGPTISSSVIPVKSSTACIMLVRGGYNANSPARVPQTGQTKCYTDFNEEMPCTGTGQDGSYQAGAAWSATRFDVNGDGTITDHFTNLMWTMDAQTPGPDPLGDASLDPILCVPGEKKTWQDALNFVKYCLNSATTPYLGYRDWRLPNKNELASLLDRSQTNPALPSAHPFTVTDTGGRWSSTTYMRNRASAWMVDMYYGDILPNPKAGQQTLYLWPVRGAYPMVTTVVADETVFPVTGTSTVVKSPAGADCATYCDAFLSNCCGTTEWPEGSERYTQGKKVTLTAKPQKGSVFVGWSGYSACEGKKGACLVTLSHDPEASTDDVMVTANFISRPTVTVSPASTRNFGKVKVLKTASATFTVRNTMMNGKQDLAISSILLSGGVNYSIPVDTNKCAALPVPNVLGPGKSCTFKVGFSPTTTGVLSDTLTISSNDPDPGRSSISVTLTGQGKP